MKETYPKFTQALLKWYAKAARQLPWRETSDPYAIWVSEVMLQQTQVDTVIPYYQRFLAHYPTLNVLAAADENDILKAWEGLGYYRRARLLLEGVREVASTYGGVVPSNPEKLRQLPGVGDYMAGSIASIAFNQPVPAVDGNVVRVVTRVLAWDEEESTARSRRQIREWVQAQIPPEHAGDFTQAMMELGALICRPKAPQCSNCPVGEECRSRDNQPERFPVKKPARKVPVEMRAVYIIWRDGKVYMECRPQGGLLAGMWEFPTTVLEDVSLDAAIAYAEQRWARKSPWNFWCNTRQTFSHRIWDLSFYETQWPSKTPLLGEEKGGWFLPNEIEKLPRVAYLRTFTFGLGSHKTEEENP